MASIYSAFANDGNMIKPYLEYKENKKIAKKGGHVAKVAREDMEKELGKSVISKENALNYQYTDEKKLPRKSQIDEKNNTEE